MRRLFVLIIVLAALATAADIAPTFTLPDTMGNKVKFGDLVASKGCILVDFWELSCFSCKQALPKYQALYEKYKDQGFVVLAISVDSVRTSSNVGPYSTGIGLTFPILLDTNNDVFRAFHVESMPTSFLVDCQGAIRYTHIGYKPGDEKETEEKIVELLKEYSEQKTK